MSHGLDHDQINPSLDQMRKLFFKGGCDFGPGSLSRPSIEIARGAHSASDEVPRGAGPSGELDCPPIYRRDLPIETMASQSKTVCPEGVRLNEIASDCQVRLVYCVDSPWPGDIPMFRGFAGREASGVKHRPKCPIGYEKFPTEPFTDPTLLSGTLIPLSMCGKSHSTSPQDCPIAHPAGRPHRNAR